MDQVPQVMRAFFLCIWDEHRTSTQENKLYKLLNDGRSNTTNPKAGTQARTTSMTGEPVSFTIVQRKKHKLPQWTDEDGVTRVAGRDEPTNTNMASVYVTGLRNKPNLHNLAPVGFFPIGVNSTSSAVLSMKRGSFSLFSTIFVAVDQSFHAGKTRCDPRSVHRDRNSPPTATPQRP
jgi:hypothetical protein